MADEPKPQSWWQTLPGILTAVAAVLTAVTGLIVALRGGTPSAPGGTAAPLPAIPAAPAAPQPANVIPAASPPAARTADAVADSPSTPASAAAIDVSGLWMSSDGEPTRITQHGKRIEFVSDGISCMNTSSRMQGEGNLDGYRVEVLYNSTLPSQGRCSGMLTPDGRSLVSNCHDSVCGAFVSTLFRR
jgi:hypothetical protein